MPHLAGHSRGSLCTQCGAGRHISSWMLTGENRWLTSGWRKWLFGLYTERLGLCVGTLLSVWWGDAGVGNGTVAGYMGTEQWRNVCEQSSSGMFVNSSGGMFVNRAVPECFWTEEWWNVRERSTVGMFVNGAVAVCLWTEPWRNVCELNSGGIFVNRAVAECLLTEQ